MACRRRPAPRGSARSPRPVLRLRRQAHRVDAERAHVRQRIDEVQHAIRLRLDAVEHEEGLALARGERQPVRVIEAAEPAVVLRQIVVARGEAARRERERQPPVGEHLGGHARRLLREDRGQRRTRHLERRHPAIGPQRREERERRGVVDVEVRSGDERRTVGDHVHRAHVVRLEQEAPVGHEPAQRLEVRLRLHQHLRREHDFLAGVGEPRGRVEPVGGPILVPARADGLAQVDAIDGRCGDRLVERVERGPSASSMSTGPSVSLHGGVPIATADGRHRAWSGGPPTGSRARPSTRRGPRSATARAVHASIAARQTRVTAATYAGLRWRPSILTAAMPMRTSSGSSSSVLSEVGSSIA